MRRLAGFDTAETDGDGGTGRGMAFSLLGTWAKERRGSKEGVEMVERLMQGYESERAEQELV